ncbi:MAG: hypothetical protein MI919_26740 [Holophagales bacterium]|nr:hypothetical protein [Holophagales bacterium]
MASPPSNDDGTISPQEPIVTIPDPLEISQLPALPGAPDGLDAPGNEVASTAYAVATATADQAFGTAFDGAKATLVAAQAAFTAAKQTYVLAVATYNSAVQTARETQDSAYDQAAKDFDNAVS